MTVQHEPAGEKTPAAGADATNAPREHQPEKSHMHSKDADPKGVRPQPEAGTAAHGGKNKHT
jgi:hypothetical protein